MNLLNQLNNLLLKLQPLLIAILITVVFAIVPNSSFAQQFIYREGESNNVRVDPKWVVSYNVGNKHYPADIAIDKQGNIYTTGYFVGEITTPSKRYYVNCKSECYETYYLMKHDSTGKLLWMSYATGVSRGIQVLVDNNGLVYTIAHVRSDELTFVAPDSTATVLDKPKMQQGTALCKYDANGQLLRSTYFSTNGNDMPSSFAIDSKSNFIIAGTNAYTLSIKGRGNEMKRRYFMVKLDANFKQQWQLQGDSLGTTYINSITVHGTNIYAAGSYQQSLTIGDAVLNTTSSTQKPFLALLNGKAKLQWLTDSLGTLNTGNAGAMAVDKKGNVIVSNLTTASIGYLTKLNKKGDILWAQTVVGKGSPYMEKMIMDDDQNFYLCGQNQFGINFPSRGKELFTMQSIGSTDFFLAKYNSNGELQWMKAGGGKMTDYCRSIAVHNGNVIAFGAYSSTITFKDTTLTNYKSNAMWLAKFDQKTLEKIDRSIPKPLSRNEQNKDGAQINDVTCICHSSQPISKRYMPPLTMLLEDSVFKKVTQWRFIDSVGLDNLLFTTLHTDGSQDYQYYSMDLVSDKPIRLIHPNKSFALNFTPCQPGNERLTLPITAGYRNAIRNYDREFDWQAFDSTAQSYFFVLTSISQIKDYTLLSKIFYDYSTIDLEQFIAKINKAYNTEMKLNLEEEEGWSVTDMILEQMNENGLDVSDVILNEYVLTSETPHHINSTEWKRLSQIFSKWIDKVSPENINLTIAPIVNVNFKTDYVSIEISEKILRRWNTLKGQPATDNTGKYLPANILASVSTLSYQNDEGIEGVIKDVCFTRSEIANTGILLTFDKAKLIDVGNLKTDYGYKFPLFAKLNADGTWAGNNDLLNNFSGLLIDDGLANMQLFDIMPTLVKVVNLLINNQMIAGTLVLPLQTNTQDGLQPTDPLTLLIDNQPVETTMAHLASFFASRGISEIEIRQQQTAIMVHFSIMP